MRVNPLLVDKEYRSREQEKTNYGNLQNCPIHININISNAKKDGDVFQRNSANFSSKSFSKRNYKIHKGGFTICIISFIMCYMLYLVYCLL